MDIFNTCFEVSVIAFNVLFRGRPRGALRFYFVREFASGLVTACSCWLDGGASL